MKSLRFFAAGCYLFFAALLPAQNAAIQKEIDEQVWLPFIKTFKAFDSEGFNALHTPDVLRGGPWGIQVGEAYRQSNIANNEQNKAAGAKRSIAFRFEHRVAQGDVAYEVGYYKVSGENDGKTWTGYGRFDVVLRKINGVWKIAQDWDVDSLNGRRFTEADFLGEKPNPVIYQ
ncbi:MAG: YybH family protein [Saprospiraceae bacterium]